MNSQKDIILDLLFHKDHFILPKVNGNGRPMYKMYSGNMVPEYYITAKTFKCIKELLKKDKRGKMTLNLTSIRQLHGNSWIKKSYKRHAKYAKL